MTASYRVLAPGLGALLASLTVVAQVPSEATPKAPGPFEAYERTIPGTEVSFSMTPIPGGTFTMGSPPDEGGRGKDEGPERKVTIDPFWMGTHEVTWDAYEQWAYSLELRRRKGEPSSRDEAADAVTRPTPPYTDMTFGMGRTGYPALCMTQLAARTYCQWLSTKTGEFYRLPTEAEWEYACRAGTTTRWSCGDDEKVLDAFAWTSANSQGTTHPVGRKKPNPFGLYDMHGNVAEWCLDQHTPKGYGEQMNVTNPFQRPTTLYPRVVRGGSWRHRPGASRSAARQGSDEQWKMQDPQLPQSVWYHTDALFVGFRLVRPKCEPPAEERRALEEGR
jgi:formylglycine-generating enzyme required for sulfatase activity